MASLVIVAVPAMTAERATKPSRPGRPMRRTGRGPRKTMTTPHLERVVVARTDRACPASGSPPAARHRFDRNVHVQRQLTAGGADGIGHTRRPERLAHQNGGGRA